MRNLSPHIAADIATSKVIVPPIIIIDFITFGSPSQLTVITVRVVNTPPRIAPKINLRINTVMSFLLLMGVIREAEHRD